MKIDLDKLERQARDQGPVMQDGRPQPGCEDYGSEHACDAHRAGVVQRIFTIGAPTTLALIARIRELEEALEEAADDIANERQSHRAQRFLDVVEKGAVLP